jgi:hypothetical protein
MAEASFFGGIFAPRRHVKLALPVITRLITAITALQNGLLRSTCEPAFARRSPEP